MAKYTVQLNYIAAIEVEVEANDEGIALDKARDAAEDADMNEFILTTEKESKIINIVG